MAALLCLTFAMRTHHSASAQSEESALLLQSQADTDRKSAGCLTCHTSTDSPTMHVTGTVRLGCIDCHGGDSEARVTSGTDEIPPRMLKRRVERIRNPAILAGPFLR